MRSSDPVKDKQSTYKSSGSLIFRFAVIFAVFTIITLILCGLIAYGVQARMYRSYVEDDTRTVAEYLSKVLSDKSLDFENHQKYLIEHADEIDIPYDFDHNYLPAKQEYEAMFSREFPGKVYGRDVSFDQMSDELKRARAVYIQEYCIRMFEQARDSFGLAYTYYMVPVEEEHCCYFVIDALRDERKADGKSFIKLSLYIDENLDKVPVLWKVWDAGNSLHEFDIYDNEFGHTYGYYFPLVIDGKPIGLIAVDREVEKVNRYILNNVMSLCIGMGIVLVLTVAILLIVIYRRHLKRLKRLVNSVQNYTTDKKVDIAKEIDLEIKGSDEVSNLAKHTSDMIRELDEYMKNLTNTAKELTETRQQARDLLALSNRDSLTGIRNKAAYEDEIRKLQREKVQGLDKFGFGMASLNGLSVINDKYGHDKGNIAIKNLCRIVCSIFKHSPVFRIGGDQFVIILRNEDFTEAEGLIVEYYSQIMKNQNDETLQPWERISASLGVALFDEDKDKTIEDVVKRAENYMKEDKDRTRESRG